MKTVHWLSFILALSGTADVIVSQPVNMVDIIQSSASTLFTKQEEAPYTVVRKYSKYEERLYPAANWICESVPLTSYEQMDTDVFLDLFGYIGGSNSGGTKMKMTIPVSLQPSSTSPDVDMCFYLGAQYQGNPPTPDNKNVSIKLRPEMTVYTSEFGGYATTEKKWLDQSNKLKSILSEDGKQFKAEHIYWNAFNSPLKFWGRRNEVWIVKN